MQETIGYVKLFRKFNKWGWYEDLVVKAVFLHCLLQQIRTALKKLELSGEISVNLTNKFTATKVIKWANYQDYDHENNKQITNKQQSNNNQTTIN